MIAALAWPILERIPLGGDVAVSPHGVGIALGVLLGARMWIRRAERWGMKDTVEDVSGAVGDVLLWVVVGGILGARLFYVLNQLDRYVDDPLSAFAVWEGGLTLLGGIVGGTLAGVVIVRRRGWDARLLLDAAAPGLAAGIAVGRFGDLAIGDHLGAPAPGSPFAWQCTGNLWERTTNSFGYVAPQPYPSGAEPVAGCFDVPVLQTAMFDVAAATATMIVLLLLERRLRTHATGTLAATFVVSYGAGRLLFDNFRGDLRYAGLTASQWLALTAILAAGTWLLARRPWELGSGEDEAAAGEETSPTSDHTS
jgi:phosphatidylglycerol:prolipoprotein diacylglycerol transferase